MSSSSDSTSSSSSSDDDSESTSSSSSSDSPSDASDTDDAVDDADGDFNDIEGALPDEDSESRIFPRYDPTENVDNRQFYGDDGMRISARNFGANSSDSSSTESDNTSDARRPATNPHPPRDDTAEEDEDPSEFGDDEGESDHIDETDEGNPNSSQPLGGGVPDSLQTSSPRSIPTVSKKAPPQKTNITASVMDRIKALELQIQRDISSDLAGTNQNPTSNGTLQLNDARLSSGEQQGFLNSIYSWLPAKLCPGPEYTALPGPSYIRVIVIHAGQSDDILSGSLEAMDLNNVDTRYEAISYQWGQPQLSQDPILLRGRSVYISATLTNILRRLRLSNHSRVLWADALCINQSDYAERLQQVGIMQRIYSRAHRVLVYLGNQSPISSDCFSAAKALTSAWLSFKKNACLKGSVEEPPCSIYEGVEMEKIMAMFDNTYWTRLWVVQEVVSSQLAIVYWGNEEISWTLLGLATVLIRNNGALWHKFTAFHNPLAISGLMNAYLMYRLPSAEFETNSMSFLDLLRLTRNFNVTVPLDRIYAILGLPSIHTGEGQSFIQPDYRLLKEGLYTRVFHRVLTTHDIPLEILSAVRHKNLFYPDFPTWVPQWSLDPIRSIGGSHREGMKFEASAGGPAKPLARVIWRLEERSLSVEGFVLGKITALHDSLPQPSDKPEERKMNMKKHSKSIITWLRKNFRQDIHGRALKLALTLTAGQDWYGAIVKDQAAKERHLRCFALWARKQRLKMPVMQSPQLPQPGDSEKQYGQAVRNVCRGRKIFAANGTILGLGPSIVRPGDIVCVVLGGPVPYVLRPLGNDMYHFVGECYVPDYMFGEAVAKWRDGMLGWQLNLFVLK